MDRCFFARALWFGATTAAITAAAGCSGGSSVLTPSLAGSPPSHATATPTPTATATAAASATPTGVSTTTPTPKPSTAPSASPSIAPTSTASPSASASATPSQAPSPSPSPAAPALSILTINGYTNTVTGYSADPVGTLNEAPIAVLSPTVAMTMPSGVAFDSAGHIYELNAGNGTNSDPANVSVYAANPSGSINESPIAVIEGSATELNEVKSIAVDSAGKIYVVGNDGTDSLIYVFAAIPAGTSGVLNEAPLAIIGGSNSGLDTPGGIAVDKSGYIYVVSENGNGGPSAGYPGFSVGNGSISVFAPNPSGTVNETPVASITGSNTGLLEPVGLGLDASGRIYVLNTGTASVAPTITVYAASPSGSLNEAPIATIAGSNTGLASDYTSALAVGSDGSIYVPVASVNEILAFPANPSGTLNEAPKGIITGSATHLENPSAIAAR